VFHHTILLLRERLFFNGLWKTCWLLYLCFAYYVVICTFMSRFFVACFATYRFSYVYIVLVVCDKSWFRSWWLEILRDYATKGVPISVAFTPSEVWICDSASLLRTHSSRFRNGSSLQLCTRSYSHLRLGFIVSLESSLLGDRPYLIFFLWRNT
jgi:hypothetical protein